MPIEGLSSVTLSSKDLPPLVKRQPSYTAIVITPENNLSAKGLSNKNILVEGRCFLRRLTGAADHDLGCRN
jgi:hypothetical protein